VNEVVEKVVQQPPKALYRLTRHTETRITEEQDWFDTHCLILPIGGD